MAADVPVVDEECCLGCAICEEICPEVFRFNDSLGYVLVINPTGTSAERIEEAMAACPSSCIYWSAEGKG